VQDVTLNKNNQLLYGLSLSVPSFKIQMQYLKNNNYQTLTLNQMLDTPLNKTVALTFDDGYIDIIQNAYPIMRQYGFHGTVFAITGMIGLPGYMDWNDLKTLQAAGWEIDSHTVNHLDLTTISAANANYQITQSKKDIEQELGTKVNFFCYPSGKYNNETVNLVKAAGYIGATTTNYGTNNSVSNIFTLERIRIDGGATLANFTSPL
jgi:peptidoglycan/xylan/chitin deacetylase (PgdA/CDA1 family)